MQNCLFYASAIDSSNRLHTSAGSLAIYSLSSFKLKTSLGLLPPKDPSEGLQIKNLRPTEKFGFF